jgi:integrase
MFLRRLKPPTSGQVEYADGACPGLRWRWSSEGVPTWTLCCRDSNGRMRRFTLGSFPAMGLSGARIAARRLRERIRDGYDPVAESRQRRAAARVDNTGIVTLLDVINHYAKHVGHTRRSWRRLRMQIEHVFAPKLRRPANELSAPELQLVVDAHPAKTSAAAGLRYLKPILKWSARRGLMTAGIAEALERPEGTNRTRDRVLSREEIHAVRAVVDDLAGYGPAVRMLFWTAARLGEVCDMRWQDLDLSACVWTIPTTKQGRPLVVPLPRQAVAILQNLTGGGDPDPTALVFTHPATGNKLLHWSRISRKIQARTGTSGWWWHDVRRTCATLLGDMGIAPHIIEICLGHVLSKSSDGQALGNVATVYNRSRYGKEHAEALQRLADELDRIKVGEPETNVVPLRA